MFHNLSNVHLGYARHGDGHLVGYILASQTIDELDQGKMELVSHPPIDRLANLR